MSNKYMDLDKCIEFYEKLTSKSRFNTINPFLHHKRIKNYYLLADNLLGLKLEFEEKLFRKKIKDKSLEEDYKICLLYFDTTNFYLERMSIENTLANVRFAFVIAGLSLILSSASFFKIDYGYIFPEQKLVHKNETIIPDTTALKTTEIKNDPVNNIIGKIIDTISNKCN